jgi:hypothetical protein
MASKAAALGFTFKAAAVVNVPLAKAAGREGGFWNTHMRGSKRLLKPNHVNHGIRQRVSSCNRDLHKIFVVKEIEVM